MSHPLLVAVDTISSRSINDVEWATLGSSENDSMPIGNGDIAANVWTEQNGDLVLLVAKSDAWTGAWEARQAGADSHSPFQIIPFTSAGGSLSRRCDIVDASIEDP